MTDLKPCPVPWCRDTDAEIECSGQKAYYVTCSLCGAKTPLRPTPEAAAEVWNTRPPLVPVVALQEALLVWPGDLRAAVVALIDQAESNDG